MDELVKRLRSQCQGYGKECEDCNADGNCRSQMENEAADAIEELMRRCEQFQYMPPPAWIPVTERLPESQGPFLTRYGFGDTSRETGQFFYGVLYYLYADADPHWQHESVGVEVTHWMPLPEPPKEE